MIRLTQKASVLIALSLLMSHGSPRLTLDRGDQGGVAHLIDRRAETPADLENESRGRASHAEYPVALRRISQNSPSRAAHAQGGGM